MGKDSTDNTEHIDSELKGAKQCTIIDTEGNSIRTYMLWDREISTGDLFVVTRGFDGCLFIFDESEFEKFWECLMEMSHKKPEGRMLGRFFIAEAIDTEFNEKKQVILPKSLLSHARIKTEAVIEGDGGFASIWSINEWQKGHFPNGISDIEKRIAKSSVSD